MGKRAQKGDETIMPENSITITADQKDAYRLDAELKHHAHTVVGEMIEIGRCLKEINDRKLYELLGCGTLAEYAEAAVGLKERAAYNYITAFETYGAEGLQKYGQLGITKLIALAQLNSEDRTEMLESGTVEDLSTRELKDKIKELKGENDQLRLDFDDITENVKKQDAELSDKEKEIAELKKQLEEAQRPVVAAMSDEEKDEIRQEAEKKARTDADKEVERWKNMRDKDAKTYQKAIKEYEADIDAKESEISKLSEKLEAANAENEKLHANAKKASPPPAGNKELLKFHFEALKSAYIGAVEVLERFDMNEREKYKTALIKISEDIRAAAEKM